MARVLLITNTLDFTTDYVVRSLKSLKADYYRLNTDEIGTSVFLSFDFCHDTYLIWDKPKGLTYNVFSFTSVYFRRPEIPTFCENNHFDDEDQFMRLELYQTLEGLYKLLNKAYWISDVDSIRRAENKIFQQVLAKEIGFQIPKGIITNMPLEFNNFVKDNNNDCVVKPVFSGQIGWPEMEKVVYTSRLTNEYSNKQIELCPTYLQERLVKKYDVRVIVVGDEIFAARIDSQSNPDTQTDWRIGEYNLYHEKVILPDIISIKCKELLCRLNLQFGAIDFVENLEGEFIFLEINPNGQWAWIEIQTGMPIANAIARHLM